jgi:hypothetical protein
MHDGSGGMYLPPVLRPEPADEQAGHYADADRPEPQMEKIVQSQIDTG